MNKSLLMSRSGVPHSCPLYDAHLETAGLHMTCMLYVISMAFPVTYLGKAAWALEAEKVPESGLRGGIICFLLFVRMPQH